MKDGRVAGARIVAQHVGGKCQETGITLGVYAKWLEETLSAHVCRPCSEECGSVDSLSALRAAAVLAELAIVPVKRVHAFPARAFQV